MARTNLNNYRDGYGSSQYIESGTRPNNNSSVPPGSNRDGSLSNNVVSSISNQVINSPAYKSAYNLFSSLTDTSWLTRLEMIPYSVDDANSSWFDEHGWTNAYRDKQDANYQYCMEQIAALVAEYQAWNNSLPVTQANQLAQAGSNAAITGQGLSNSNIPNVGVSTNPASVASANPLDMVLNLANLFLSGVGQFTSTYEMFSRLKLDKQKFAFDKEMALFQNNLSAATLYDSISRYASENDYQMSYPDFTSFKDALDSDDFTGQFFVDPNSSVDFDINKVKGFIKNQQYLPLVEYLNQYYPDFAEKVLSYEDSSGELLFGIEKSSGLHFSNKSVEDVSDTVLDTLWEMYLSRLADEADKYDSEVLQAANEAGISVEEYKQSKSRSDITKHEKEQADIFAGLLNKLYTDYKNGDAGAKVLLYEFFKLSNGSTGSTIASFGNSLARHVRGILKHGLNWFD